MDNALRRDFTEFRECASVRMTKGRQATLGATFAIVLPACFMAGPTGAGPGLERPKNPYPVTLDRWMPKQELTAANGARGDVFGYSVAVSGQTVIIGAAGRTIGNNSGQGAAYVFTCSGIPCTWSQKQELTASDGARDDEFGNSVAVSGNTAVIGAWGKHSLYLPGAPKTALAPQGAAYVFTCSGIPCHWTQQQELTASDGASRDQFGNRVAANGNTVIISNNSSKGAAYVFTCSGTPCTWTQQQELTASDGAHGDEFGYSVAVSGNTAIISAAYEDSYRGAAYVFNAAAVANTDEPTPGPPPSPRP